ncbi:hypothetical protein Mro02_29480 [Microbispora rosea subsp. aerata]|nr:hypothetical protein Mro02_29480 [Microbispora rosea subsp. aerata]GLJ86635.1 hypothetical protein GCM10017588_53730 [Microbispora rosea subsp. aerata]
MNDFVTGAAVGGSGGADYLGTCHPAAARTGAGHVEGGHADSALPEFERGDSGGERGDAHDAQDAGAIDDTQATEETGDGRNFETAQGSRRAAVDPDDAGSTRRQGNAQGQGPCSGESQRGEWRSCDPPGDTLSGLVPGLLLATGQVLPVSGVHRLARTSTLVRLVMDAEGQVLDMGRKVRLATPAQRRAIFARYATCWVDGCPLPATLCQIDHADNWSTGGLTDLKLLGPACQFHNRDRYRHPERYTRRRVGKDRWAFTYHRLTAVRRSRE